MGTKISDTECYPLCIDANGKLSTPYKDRKAGNAQPSALIAAGYKYAVTAWGTIIENYKSTTADTWDEIVHQGKYVRQVIGQFQNGDYFVCSFDGIKGSINVNEAGMDMITLRHSLFLKEQDSLIVWMAEDLVKRFCEIARLILFLKALQEEKYRVLSTFPQIKEGTCET